MNSKNKLLTFSILLAFSIPSQALLITPSDITTEDLGDFSANVEWNGSELSIALSNTSNGLNGGFITGFLVELPSGASFNVGWTDTGLQFMPSDNGPYSGSPYGNFDYGYSLGGNLLGGGSPAGGIGIGETGNFLLSDWQNADNLTTEDFIANYDTSILNDASFLVRFRGFNDEGSDKVLGVFGEIDIPGLPGPPSSAEIPEPNSLMLFLLGILCVVGLRKGIFSGRKFKRS